MDPREKDMLKRALELAEENNEMLHSLQRSARLGIFFKALYWILIIGTAFGAYYFIQPYVDQLSETYTGFQDNVGEAQGLLEKAKAIIPGGN